MSFSPRACSIAVRSVIIVVMAVSALATAGSLGAKADESEKSWREMRQSLFGGRPIMEEETPIRLSAPYRAEDPALVPVQIEYLQQAANGNPIRILTLIVDENPAPIAAVFTFGSEAHVSALETRVRINAYSFVRAIAEMADGTLFMVKSYVKATGGCAASASKNPDDAIASIGQMRLREYSPSETSQDQHEIQLQIRHPNYSGLQMDQLTGHYRPAHFVNSIRIEAQTRMIMTVEGAISLSENPTLRFKYNLKGSNELSAYIEDTEGNVFKKNWYLTGKQS